MDRFYIFNCFDEVVGNQKGYRTIKGAIREQDKRGSKAFNAIWEAFDKARSVNPEHSFISKVTAKDIFVA